MSVPIPATASSLVPTVRNVLAKHLGGDVQSIAADSVFTDVLDNYDSLSASECIFAIEERFGIEVDFTTDDVRYWFATIDRISQFVGDRLEDIEVHRD